MNKYKVTKPFSILNIFKAMRMGECNNFDTEFENLLNEKLLRTVGRKWSKVEHIESSRVLMRNLPWLEKQGWIEKVIKFKEGDEVLVWRSSLTQKRKRIFAYMKGNQYFCYDNGQTKWTSDRIVTGWDNCTARVNEEK